MDKIKHRQTSDWRFFTKVFIAVAIVSILIPLLCVIYKNNSSVNIASEKHKEIIFSSDDVCFEKEPKNLRYWGVCLNEWHSGGSLRTMNRVFKRLNYEIVNRLHGDDWDILWSIEHVLGSFDDNEDISLFADARERPFEIHQKINHFPGIGILITKVTMNDNNRDSKYILPFFELPYDEDLLQEYLIDNPHKELLEKNVYNRGVKIIDVKDIDSTEDSDLFYQEFMSNHFLIDGHAFDFGVFVLITSFDPVRVYRYEDILLRFCPKKYHPFDRDDTEKYVVQEGCLSPYEMPTFRELHKEGFTIKTIFEHHIKRKGFSLEDFWARIDDAIVSIILNSEEFIIEKLQKRNISSHHFFEVVRFDFVLDVDLNPYVLEVNMSPNLTPAHVKFEDNALIYEQLVYNVIKIIGGGSFYEFWARFDC